MPPALAAPAAGWTRLRTVPSAALLLALICGDPLPAAELATLSRSAERAVEVDLPGQPAPVRAFRGFDKRNSPGLPQSTTMALLQDDLGVLWIATLDGLGYFHGDEIRSLPPEGNSPTSGPFRALARRRKGGLYAAGLGHLYLLVGESSKKVAAPSTLISLAEDRRGQLLGVDEAGRLWRNQDLEAESWQPVSLPAEAGKGVALAQAADGTVYAAAERQVLRWGSAGLLPLPAGRLPGSAQISSLLAASEGSLWVGTTAGDLFVARAGDGSWHRADLGNWDGGGLRCLAEDRRGRVWTGGDRGRLAHGRNGEAFELWTPANGVRDATIGALLGDREGSVWLGFNGWGLQQWVGEGWSHRNRWRGEAGDSPRLTVFGITPTSDGFLAAVFTRGIWRWDGRILQQFGRAEGLAEDTRFAVEPEPGTIWVGARHGLFESHRGAPFRQTLRLAAGFVTGIFRNSAGEWLAATSTAGIFRRQANSWFPATELNAVLPSPNVRALVWRRNGEQWIGTIAGVVVVRDGQALRLPELIGLGQGVNCLLEVGPEEMWIGGFGGIWIVGPQGLRSLTAGSGLPGRTIYSLLRAPDGTIWAGGSGGVGRFAGGRWTVYDAASGLIEEECNLHGLALARDGSLLVGTMGSLARFDPSVPPLPPAALRLFWRFPTGLGASAAGARLVLPPRTERVRLGWRAPWLLPQPLEYRTRLRRLGPIWSESTREPSLVLERTAPGVWGVEVSARLAGSGEERWTPPLVAEVVFTPRWWERRGLHLTGSALALALLVALFHAATGRLARRAAALDREVARRTSALEESNRQLAAAHAQLLELARRDGTQSPPSGRPSEDGRPG